MVRLPGAESGPPRARRLDRLPGERESVAEVVLQLDERGDLLETAQQIRGTQIEAADRLAAEGVELLRRERLGGKDRERARGVEHRGLIVRDDPLLEHVVTQLRPHARARDVERAEGRLDLEREVEGLLQVLARLAGKPQDERG